jgi:hypothetical protein
LNADEEIALVQWVHRQIEPPTIDEFLQEVSEIRRATLTAIEPILARMQCPAIVLGLSKESQEKCRSWARCAAHRLQLKFTFPEALETMRSVYATTTLVNRWFLQMGPEVDGVPPTSLFNFDEIMVSSDLHCKLVTTCNKTVFRRKAPKAPHITLGLCVSPFGDGPPPFLVLPSVRKVNWALLHGGLPLFHWALLHGGLPQWI